MTPLKVSELVEGKIYQCRLSGLKVLLKKIPLKWTDTFQGKAVSEWQITCLYFSPGHGLYQQIDPSDYQFTEIPAE